MELYVAGQFDKVGSITRNNIASFDVNGTTYTLNSFAPVFDDFIVDMFVIDDYLYLGGSWTVIDGVDNYGLARFNLITHTHDTSWNPGDITKVHRIKSITSDGTQVFFTGNFQTYLGQSRRNAAAININTQTLTSWHPDCGGISQGSVTYNARYNVIDNFVYIGAKVIGAADDLARVDTVNGTVDATWTPTGFNQNGAVTHNFAFDNTSVWICGEFNSLNFDDRTYIARVSNIDGSTLSFNANITPPNSVGLYGTSIAFSQDGNTVYLACFNDNHVADPPLVSGYNIATGSLVWNPSLDYLSTSNMGGRCVLTGSVIVAGRFANVNGDTTAGGLAIFDDGTSVPPLSPKPTGQFTFQNLSATLFTLANYGVASPPTPTPTPVGLSRVLKKFRIKLNYIDPFNPEHFSRSTFIPTPIGNIEHFHGYEFIVTSEWLAYYLTKNYVNGTELTKVLELVDLNPGDEDVLPHFP